MNPVVKLKKCLVENNNKDSMAGSIHAVYLYQSVVLIIQTCSPYISFHLHSYISI